MSREKFMNLMIIISKLVFYIFSAVVIYWIILKLANHSPTLDIVMVTLLTILVPILFYIVAHLSREKGKNEIFRQQFYSLAKDFKILVADVHGFTEKVGNLDGKVSTLSGDLNKLSKTVLRISSKGSRR